MYRLALDLKARRIVLIAGILLAASLLALTLHRSAFAQEGPIEYPENGKGPVATFTAEDPEGITPIIWDVLADDANFSGIDDVDTADAADAEDFDIDEDGTLEFSDPPDYENPQGAGTPISNTYKVVVVAADGTGESANRSYYKVTVKVTDVAEEGEVSWTVDSDGGETHVETPPKLTQFQAGASLMASVEDGDLEGTQDDPTDKTVVAQDHADVDANPTWRWYRSSSKTSTGTMIDGANSDTYHVVPADVGMYLRAVAYYLVTGNVDQETASLTSDYPVLAVRLGDNELEFDPDGVSRSVAEGKKGANVGAPVTATGNHGAVNYTLVDSGDAAGATPKFKIDPKTGQITTAVELDYDAAEAVLADNCRDTTGATPHCTVNVRATDASGDATAEEAGDNVFVDAEVTIKVTDVNEKPDFDEGEEDSPIALRAITRDEGDTSLFVTGATDGQPTTAAEVTYMATDPEGVILTYRLMGPDGAKFQLSASQVLSFKTKADFEKPTDRNKDNVYEVTVRASDGTLNTDRMVKVTVTGVDDAPTVSGPSSEDYVENGKGPVATFTAEDPEGATPITWSLATPTQVSDEDDLDEADNADAGDFEIDNEDGVLTFNIDADNDGSSAGSPDFENPRGGTNSGCDVTADPNPCSNTYKVVVAATDAATGGQTGYHKVTVKVTNVAEQGKVTWTVDPTDSLDSSDVNDGKPIVQFQVGALLTASATDGDIEGAAKAVPSPTWRWYRGRTLITGDDAQDNIYTVTAGDLNSRIRVVATYRIGDSTEQDTASLTSDHPVLRIRFGANELEFDPDEVSREVSEGKKGADVGDPVTATGNHGVVNYALGSDTDGVDNARFKIDPKTGQITTNVELDYEGETGATADAAGSCSGASSGSPDRECTVTVSATDASGEAAADEATVTIKLKDVDEKPTFTPETSPQTITRDEGNISLFETGATDGQATTAADVTYAATDPEGLNVNLTLMGADGAKFGLNSNGELSFKEEPDYENPTDADKDNAYEVTVRASDGTLNEDRMVTVTVENVDEAPEITIGGLAISGPARVNYAEGYSTAVGTYTALGENAASARWTLEGADSGDFRLSTTSGASVMLRFRSTPDYESAADADTNNVYEVTLKATEGTNTDTHEVTVTVTDVDDTEQPPTQPTTLLDRYDADDSGDIDQPEVIEAINDYLFGTGTDAITKDQAIEVINLYLFG